MSRKIVRPSVLRRRRLSSEPVKIWAKRRVGKQAKSDSTDSTVETRARWKGILSKHDSIIPCQTCCTHTRAQQYHQRQPAHPLEMLAKSSCSAVSAAFRPGATSQRCWNTVYQQRRQHLHTSRPRQSSWPVSAPQEQEPADDVVKAGTADAPEGSHLAGGSGSQERRSTRLQQSAPIDRTDAGHSKARGKLEMPKSQPGKSISQLGDMKRQGKPV